MISLPAIEAALRNTGEAAEHNTLAIVPIPKSKTELILITTTDESKQQFNQRIRLAGLSTLHQVSKAILLDEISQLGSGKVDYQTLSSIIK